MDVIPKESLPAMSSLKNGLSLFSTIVTFVYVLPVLSQGTHSPLSNVKGAYVRASLGYALKQFGSSFK